MNDLAIPPIPPALPTARQADTPARVLDAAQQFEALLIGQLLQSVSESSGWMGSGGDSSGSCATGFAQQQLALMLAKSGGLGLSGLIAEGLESSASSSQLKARS